MKKPVCTISLVIINIVVFLILSFQGMTEDSGFMLEHGAMYAPYVLERGEYYRIITSMFLHFGFQHLMNNMVMLFVAGQALEAEAGKVRFVIIYFVSGICGTVLSLCQHIYTGQDVVSAGASGAVFGLLGAVLSIAVRRRGRVGNISGRGLLFATVLSLYYGFTQGETDNFAHIGGLFGGVILATILHWNCERESSVDTRN